MNLNWIDEFNPTQASEIHALMEKEWWCNNRKLADVEKILLSTNIALAMTNNHDTIIAFGRVLTDYVYKALIFDVIVAEPFRNQGLGKSIINKILSLETLAEVKSFELYCPDHMSIFYEELGFKRSQSKLLTLTR